MDPYGKTDVSITDDMKRTPGFRPSDMSNDSQDDRCQRAHNYEPMRDIIREKKPKQAAKGGKPKPKAPPVKPQTGGTGAKPKTRGKKGKKGKTPPPPDPNGQDPNAPEDPPENPNIPPPPPPEDPIVPPEPNVPPPPAPAGRAKVKKQWKDLYKACQKGTKEAEKHLTRREIRNLQDASDDELEKRWTEDGKRDLTCPRCPQHGPFANFTSLQDHHRRRHRDLYIYECDVEDCHKSFATKGTLTAHKKYHQLTDEEK